MRKQRAGFTLIEVMISVLIISVVIMALLEMLANSTHIFSSFLKQTKTNQYASFFLSNEIYGFEKDSVKMDELVSDFKIEDDLRRKLKNIKVEIIYQKIDSIDLGNLDLDEEENQDQDMNQAGSDMVFEIGKTILKVEDKSIKEFSSTSLLRLRIQ